MEKLPKELLSEDKNTRVSVAYEAETAVMKGKFQKKEHRKQMGVFFSKMNICCLRVIGAAASALPSHGRGRRFDSYITHDAGLVSVYCGHSLVGKAQPCQG